METSGPGIFADDLIFKKQCPHDLVSIFDYSAKWNWFWFDPVNFFYGKCQISNENKNFQKNESWASWLMSAGKV